MYVTATFLTLEGKPFGAFALVAISLNNLAHVYFQMKDIPKAIELFEKAYLICQNTLGKNHPHTKQVKRDLEYVKKMQP